MTFHYVFTDQTDQINTYDSIMSLETLFSGMRPVSANPISIPRQGCVVNEC